MFCCLIVILTYILNIGKTVSRINHVNGGSAAEWSRNTSVSVKSTFEVTSEHLLISTGGSDELSFKSSLRSTLYSH